MTTCEEAAVADKIRMRLMYNNFFIMYFFISNKIYLSNKTKKLSMGLTGGQKIPVKI